MNQQLFTLKEAAERLSMGTGKLKQAVELGLVKTVLIGSSIRIHADEIIRIAQDGLPTLPKISNRRTRSRFKAVRQGRKVGRKK